MCHSCVSRNPGCFVPAPVGLMGNQDLWNTFLEYFLDSRLRGNDTLGLARQENGRLFHSAKMLLGEFYAPIRGWFDWPASRHSPVPLIPLLWGMY